MRAHEVKRTPADVRGRTDDAVWCVPCGDYMTLTGTPEQRAADATWFEGHHTDGVEAPKPRGMR